MSMYLPSGTNMDQFRIQTEVWRIFNRTPMNFAKLPNLIVLGL